ncbi:MAG: hypothetical protein HUJ31_17795, partial [Pseudomonadales bacterium]|nr:hypothetical protein [Pseudomonadales bacterium]
MEQSKMEQLWRTGHLSGNNASYVEELYEKYLEDPSEIPEQWRSYFETLPRGTVVSHPSISPLQLRNLF